MSFRAYLGKTLAARNPPLPSEWDLGQTGGARALFFVVYIVDVVYTFRAMPIIAMTKIVIIS